MQEPEQTQKSIVKTTYGDISGTAEEGAFSFKGIPYARAERFMSPQAPDIWEGVHDRTKFGPMVMQSAMDKQKLFTVNVWTQGLNDGKKGLSCFEFMVEDLL